MGLLSWLNTQALPAPALRHTDTEPSAYPIEYQLDSVIWHTYQGLIDPISVPAIYAATDLIAASIARLDTEPSTPLSRDPDRFRTRYDFFFETVWALCVHGDAYWYFVPTTRGVEEMQVLPPTEVDIRWDDTLGRKLPAYTWNGKAVPSDRLRHLRFYPRPGQLHGLSPIEAARATWTGAAYSEEWGSSLFSASGVPSGVLEAPTPLTAEEASELKAQWHAARQGSRSTAVLSGGMKYTPVELSPSDIGWLDTRASNAQEVARIFHIPSDFLEVGIQGGGSSITYRSLSEIGADFVSWCLEAYLTILEQAWVSLPGQPRIAFITKPLYEESLEARARTFQLLTTSGVDPSQAAVTCGFDFDTFQPVGVANAALAN